MSFSIHQDVRQATRLTAMWLVLVTIPFIATACGAHFTATPEPTRLTALIYGELAMVDGCLRVNERISGTSYLLAWPPDFAVSEEKDEIQIVKQDGEKVVLRVGEMIRLSGGEVWSARFLDERVQQKLPPHCPGPYWVVGIEVAPVTGDNEP